MPWAARNESSTTSTLRSASLALAAASTRSSSVIGGHGPRGVEHPGQRRTGAEQEEGGEVASVDRLERACHRGRHDDLAAFGRTVRPPREPPCVVVGPDHVPGSHDRRTLAEDFCHPLLAERLQRPVRAAADLLGRLVLERSERAGLVHRRSEAGVDGDRRDVDVARDAVAQVRGGVADQPRHVARDVDARVPVATVERRETTVPIAEDVLGLRKETGVRLAAVEQRQLVARRERRLDDRAADELRATEHEDLHSSSATPPRRRSTSSSVL